MEKNVDTAMDFCGLELEVGLGFSRGLGFGCRG